MAVSLMARPESIAIVGGGIIGLTTAWTLLQRDPDLGVTVFEKEPEVGLHQSSHNSGVVHAGLYYMPGSLKAQLCVRGRRILEEFCADNGLPYEMGGKLVVALDADEEGRLEAIYSRARANGVQGLRLLDPGAMAEVEPHVKGRAALHSPETAVCDFGAVVRSLASRVTELGGLIRTGTELVAAAPNSDQVTLETTQGIDRYDHIVVCAGLQTDRVAGLFGDDADPSIVPFRGEYLRVAPPGKQLVRSLIYPVPDPRFPFLGVHFTRNVHDEVLLGPNALLAFAREGYRLGIVRYADLRDIVRWQGFRTFARQHWTTGVREFMHSTFKRLVLREARKYIPDLEGRDLSRGPTGVRAQAVARSGQLVEDFVINSKGPVTIVRNAPSPAATSSFAIAEVVSDAAIGRTEMVRSIAR
ncbi:MAG: L-2-hydroxyglutarate oxidase [Actinomycetota bacterium]